jgi:hypothetical protein
MKTGELGKTIRIPLQDDDGVAVNLTTASTATLIYSHAGVTTTASPAMTIETPKTTGYVAYDVTATDFTSPGVYSLEVEVLWSDGDKSKTEHPILFEVNKALR